MKTPSTLKLPPDAPETSTPSTKALAQIIQAHTKATEQLAAAMERQSDALAQIAALVSHLGQVVVNAAEDAAERFALAHPGLEEQRLNNIEIERRREARGKASSARARADA